MRQSKFPWWDVVVTVVTILGCLLYLVLFTVGKLKECGQ